MYIFIIDVLGGGRVAVREHENGLFVSTGVKLQGRERKVQSRGISDADNHCTRSSCEMLLVLECG